MYDIVIEGMFVDPVDGIFRGFMGVQDGRIAYLTETPIQGKVKMVLSGSELVFPGFIDTHVHFREPGWEHKGDMASESRAALLGGVTTAMDMPNTPVQTTSRERLLEKRRIAANRAAIDMEFYMGVGPGNMYRLEGMADVAPAFKLFMCGSTGNLSMSGTEETEEAFSCMSGMGKPLAVHCEDQAMNREAALRHGLGENDPLSHAFSRPAESEVSAIRDALGLSSKYGVPLSVCHVSTGEGMRLVMGGGARAEATIHHSLLDRRDLERLGAFGKMNPPLREREDADSIMESVMKGDVSFIGTDHAPHTRQEKGMAFQDAPSGVPGIEHYGCFAGLLLSGGMKPEQLARATSYNASQFFGFAEKARIEEGFLADLVVMDTARRVEVRPPYQAKCGWSPLEGMSFPGSPSCTIRRGRVVMENGRVLV